MAGQGENFLAITGVPNADAAVAIPARQPLAIGTEGQSIYPIRVLFDFVLKFARPGGIDFYKATGASESDFTLVRTDIGSQDRVIFVADGDEPLATHDVPNNDPARFCAMAAAGHEQFSVAAEFQIDRKTFRKRENAQQLQTLAVIKQHLLLTCHSH